MPALPEQPGSAGSRKAAHQLAAMLQNRSESPPAYSTYLKTSVTRFGKKQAYSVPRQPAPPLHPCPAPLRRGKDWPDRKAEKSARLPLPRQLPKLSSHAARFRSEVRFARRQRFLPCAGAPRESDTARVSPRRGRNTQCSAGLYNGEQNSQTELLALSQKQFHFPYKQWLQITRCLE